MNVPENLADYGYDERRLDSIVWPRIGKRFRECTHTEIEQVIAILHAEAAADRRRARLAEQQIAAGQALIDQYNASVADGVARAEAWANGGTSCPPH